MRPTLIYVSPYAIPSIKADAGQDVSMCAAFSTLGWDVHLMHRNGDSRLFGNDLFDHYGVGRTFASTPVARAAKAGRAGPLGATQDIGGTLLFALRVLRHRPDMFYTRDPIVAWVLSRRGVCVAWEAMSFPDRSKRPFAQRFLKTSGTSCAFAITAALAQDIESEVGAGRHVVPLPVGVDVTRYGQYSDGPSDRLRLGLPPKGSVAAYTGGMRPDRGVDVIVRAAALLPSVTFLLVGGRAGEIETLTKLASALGAHNVLFIRSVPPTEVPLYQHAADVLLLPQSGNSRHLRYHVSPAKLFEYMAASRPIVAADLPCIRELVKHGEEALLVDPDSPSAWADAIEAVLNDLVLRGALIQHASRRVESFDWGERVKKVLRCTIER